MSRRCENCGREGTLNQVSDVVLSSRTIEIEHHPNHAIDEATDSEVLQIQRYTVCGAPTLDTYRWIDGWSDPTDEFTYKRVFPSEHNLGDLPLRVRERYQSMRELLHAPDAFAVRAGRLLEAVCSDQGVTDGDLGPRLDQLASKKHGLIPTGLAQQAHLVREFRNFGGHDDDVEVQAEDVPLIREFVEAILEYLYWGPRKLERGRTALQERIDASRQS